MLNSSLWGSQKSTLRICKESRGHPWSYNHKGKEFVKIEYESPKINNAPKPLFWEVTQADAQMGLHSITSYAKRIDINHTR